MVDNSWKQVDPSTIQKCFLKCGFVLCTNDDNEIDSTDDEYDDVPIAVFQMSRDIFGVDFNDLVLIDKELSTSDSAQIDWDVSAQELLKSDEELSSDEECDSEQSVVSCTVSDVQECISKIKDFALVNGDGNILTSIMKVQDRVNSMIMNSKSKQAKISDYFTKQ